MAPSYELRSWTEYKEEKEEASQAPASPAYFLGTQGDQWAGGCSATGASHRKPTAQLPLGCFGWVLS